MQRPTKQLISPASGSPYLSLSNNQWVKIQSSIDPFSCRRRGGADRYWLHNIIEYLSTLSNFSRFTYALLAVSLATCGVQFMSRGRGRSAEQSGASAGCCRCRNMVIRLHHSKQIFRTWPSQRPHCDGTSSSPTFWDRPALQPYSSLLVRDFSSVTMTFRKFVFRFPPLCSNIQLALHHFPPHSVSLHCVRGDTFWLRLAADDPVVGSGGSSWKVRETPSFFLCAKGVNRARWAGGHQVGSYPPPSSPDGCHLDLRKNPQMISGTRHLTARFIAQVKYEIYISSCSI